MRSDNNPILHASRLSASEASAKEAHASCLTPVLFLLLDLFKYKPRASNCTDIYVFILRNIFS